MIYFILAFLACTVVTVWIYGLRSIAPKRLYKSGTGWCVWRWTTVPSDYIRRLHVIKTPWWALCLHWINGPDPEPWLHDHPVSFLSIILRGGYAEKRERNGKLRMVVHRWFNFVRASDQDKHTIILVRKNTLTLCFMGPKVRPWGFHTDDGWVFWKTYNDDKYTPATVKAMNAILRDVYSTDAVVQAAMQPSPALAMLTKEHRVERGKAAFVEAWKEFDRALEYDPDKQRETMHFAKEFDAEFDDEEPTEPQPYADFEISREDFYKKVKF